MKTCCFTGHRNLNHSEKEVEKMARALVMDAITNKGSTHFISGGAIGFDIIVAELIIKLKNEFNITLEIAIPCPEQDRYWTEAQKARYKNILVKADKQTVICNYYNKFCMQLRNKYMVNNSNLIIAYFNGSAGGTKNTIEFAKRNGVEIWLLNY